MGELTVVGASFGRTGTTSVRKALEHLGFGPCHYLRHLYGNHRHGLDWLRVADGEPPDFGALLGGFGSTVAWPASCFWRELAEANPSAKVLLLHRDPADWYASVARTLYLSRPRRSTGAGDRVMDRLIWNGVFGGRFTDPRYAMDVYRDHYRDVRDTVPADRLIEFDPARGWPPLCEALGVPVPGHPFPHANSTDEYLDRVRATVPAQLKPGGPLDDKGTLVAKRV